MYINVLFFNLIQNVTETIVMRCINHVLVEPQHQQNVTVITVIRSVTVMNTTAGKASVQGTECYM